MDRPKSVALISALHKKSHQLEAQTGEVTKKRIYALQGQNCVYEAIKAISPPDLGLQSVSCSIPVRIADRKEEILWLQITVHDSQLMAVMQHVNHLSKAASSFSFTV